MPPTLPAPHAVVDVAGEDGAPLRLRRHGKPGAVRLFVSHGNGFAANGYAPFWRPLLARFEIVVFDMRNHGENPLGDPAAHDYAHMARDLNCLHRAAAAEFGAKPSAGLFHSMSAQAAMVAALEIGWRFDALLLFDPPNVPPPAHPARATMLAYLERLAGWAERRPERFADPSDLARDYAGTRAGRRWVAGAHELMAHAVLRREADGACALRCPRALEASMYRQGMTLGLWPDRARFAGPVLLVGADPAMAAASPTALANRALAAEGGFEYRAISRTGHLLQLEEPAACVAAAQAFLAAAGLA